MAVTYPLSLPSIFKSSEVTIVGKNLVGIWKDPYGLTRQTYEFPGKQWQATIKTPPYTQQQAEQLVGWLLSLNGAAGTFYLNDTSHRNPFGVATGTPTVGSSAAAGSTDLPTGGWTHSVNGILAAGDWLQVGTGSSRRLHKVVFNPSTSDGSWNSDSSGNLTVTVWPRLRAAYASGTTIVTQNAAGIFYLKEDPTWMIPLNRRFGISLVAEESTGLT